jgi:hypothetical protein
MPDGQGDIAGTEGVEGLQRGFKMAGVRYLILSLWEVSIRKRRNSWSYSMIHGWEAQKSGMPSGQPSLP